MDKKISHIGREDEELMLQILKALRSIRYGYVQIIVQDSKIVQIDKTEKIRFDRVKDDFSI